jgi:hypothetical protein
MGYAVTLVAKRYCSIKMQNFGAKLLFFIFHSNLTSYKVSTILRNVVTKVVSPSVTFCGTIGEKENKLETGCEHLQELADVDLYMTPAIFRQIPLRLYYYPCMPADTLQVCFDFKLCFSVDLYI